jgi:predicted nucleic acid-binding protein
MRVVLISSLLIQVGHPAAIYHAWQEGAFTLVVCAEQLDELRATLRKPSHRRANQTAQCRPPG